MLTYLRTDTGVIFLISHSLVEAMRGLVVEPSYLLTPARTPAMELSTL